MKIYKTKENKNQNNQQKYLQQRKKKQKPKQSRKIHSTKGNKNKIKNNHPKYLQQKKTKINAKTIDDTTIKVPQVKMNRQSVPNTANICRLFFFCSQKLCPS